MTDLQPGGLQAPIEKCADRRPGGNGSPHGWWRQPSCCSKSQDVGARGMAPENPRRCRRTTSAQSRHTATGWPSRSTTIDTTSQVPNCDSHSGDSLAAGFLESQGSGFCSLGEASVVRRAPCSSLRFETHPPARSGASGKGPRAGHPSGWGDGHGGPALATQPKPGDARPVLTRCWCRLAFAIWFMLSIFASAKCASPLVAAAFQLHRQGDGLDVRHPHHRQHRHHLSSVTANGWLAGFPRTADGVCAGTCRANRRGHFARIMADQSHFEL